MRKPTKRQAARAAADSAKLAAKKQAMVGTTHRFCGGNKDALLPFGSTWVTSDGYKVQCVSVAHSVHEYGCYFGVARVVAVNA